MHKIIDNLRNDHINIAKLLTLLDQQAGNLKSGVYTDYQLMSDIMRYFVNFPDIYHHPHEDLIFDVLKDKDQQSASMIEDLQREHQTMAEDSSQILDQITQIQGNAIFSREALVGRVLDYISRYRSHIKREEADLFKRAEERLDDKDWSRIHTAMHVVDDPLFGKIQEDEYANLFRVILAGAVDA